MPLQPDNAHDLGQDCTDGPDVTHTRQGTEGRLGHAGATQIRDGLPAKLFTADLRGGWMDPGAGIVVEASLAPSTAVAALVWGNF